MTHPVQAPASSRPVVDAAPEPQSGTQPAARPVRRLPASVTTWLWGTGAVVLATIGGFLAFAFNRSFYWRGDTQVAYFGALYHLGESLRDGRIPLMDPASWHGGAFAVDSSWGLFNPLTWIQALGATVISDAIAYMTVVKIAIFAIGASGTFLLARSYRVADPLACVVAVLVPLSGFTMYADQPSWYHGSLVSCLLPWAWWGVRRTVLRDANPFPGLLAGYLLATVGYVFGTVMLAVVIGCTIIDGLLARRWGGAARGLLVGICCGLPTLAVHLPFVLSSSATVRSDWSIDNTGLGLANLTQLAASSIPTIGSDQPLFYVGWVLPMLVFVDWRRARAGSRDLVGIIAVAAVSWIWLLGPSDIGPLRWPMRMMPYIVLVTLLLGAIAFMRGRTAWSVQRLLVALAITAVSGYMTMAGEPPYWRQQLVVTLAVAAGLTLTWLLLRGTGNLRPQPAVAAALAAVWTVGLVGIQHHYVPQSNAGDRGMPAEIADYRDPLPAAVGNTFMVGHPRELVRPDSNRRPFLPIGNAWYLRGLDNQNAASATRFAAYNSRYCMNFLGDTCPEALTKLLEREPTTGLSRADLMSVSTIALVKREVPKEVRRHPPAGWHVAAADPVAVTWVRDRPMPPAGGVTWKQKGLDLTTLSQEPETVRLRVNRVPSGGGTFVMSRLAWPGYEISSADLAPAIDDALLAVRVPESSEGKVVTLSYAPPHWNLLWPGLLGAVGLGLVWSVAAAVIATVRRRKSGDGETPAASAG